MQYGATWGVCVFVCVRAGVSGDYYLRDFGSFAWRRIYMTPWNENYAQTRPHQEEREKDKEEKEWLIAGGGGRVLEVGRRNPGEGGERHGCERYVEDFVCPCVGRCESCEVCKLRMFENHADPAFVTVLWSMCFQNATSFIAQLSWNRSVTWARRLFHLLH